jgi:septum formation protein
MIDLPYRLVLGSNSPRRRQLLAELGFAFEVRVLPTDESYPPDLPKREVAAYLARRKAEALLPTLADDELCVAADTTVVLGNALLEKAPDAAAARDMLERLSGQVHEVVTGVCLQARGRQAVFQDSTKVHFRRLESREISYYIDKFAPFDKAGAYGIQEWIGMAGISKIEGSYFNVVGLPTEMLFRHLKAFARP